MKFAIFSKTWGWLVIPRHPSLWLEDESKAYRFPSRRAALKESARWAKGLVEVREIEGPSTLLNNLRYGS